MHSHRVDVIPMRATAVKMAATSRRTLFPPDATHNESLLKQHQRSLAPKLTET